MSSEAFGQPMTPSKRLITQSMELGTLEPPILSLLLRYPPPHLQRIPTYSFLHILQALLRKFTTACCSQAWADAGLGSPSPLCTASPRPVPPRASQCPKLTRCFLVWAG